MENQPNEKCSCDNPDAFQSDETRKCAFCGKFMLPPSPQEPQDGEE